MRYTVILSLFAVTDFVAAVGPCFCCDSEFRVTFGQAVIKGGNNCEDMTGKLREGRGKLLKTKLVTLA